ncbi:hypothetical protein LTR84_005622 [Exophiala bonariae]|uniref:Zn(2)-C6 fungal-type domain-containing protein n=1 Tax=Exophiala bonariae TaxID=1690606 RepID=A0AAV9N5Q6_9EURO|nr:hypothetical protein LTR84_005622 [Exophiala bonariae]
MESEVSTVNENTTPNPQSREAASPAFAPSMKIRVRTGCDTCRSRKVKCDEQRPVCQKCTRLKRTCTYRLPSASHSPQTLHEDLSPPVSSCQAKISDSSENIELQVESALDPLAKQTNLEVVTPDVSMTAYPDVAPVAAQPTDLSRDAIQWSQNNRSSIFYPASQIGVVDVSPTDQFHSTSELIYMSTVLDWMGVSEVPAKSTFAYFLDVVDCTLLSPFDQLNWRRMKQYIAYLGLEQPLVADFLRALQALYRSQVDHLPRTYATTLQQIALDNFESVIGDTTVDFEILLICAFLQCLCAVTAPNEDGPSLGMFDGLFTERLQSSLEHGPQSAIFSRICAWLQLLNTVTKHPGSVGLLSNTVLRLLYSRVGEQLPSLSMLDRDAYPERGFYDTIAEPVFTFYIKLQKISNQITDVTHYRRSRSTAADQEEVSKILADLTTKLATLWEHRPPPLQLEPIKIRESFSETIAKPLIMLAGLCIAAFQVETIVIGRILGDPPFPTPEIQHARLKIRQVIEGEGEWLAADEAGALNPGYLRPLFVYALESFVKDQSDWAACQLRRIKHPNSTGNFLASFVEAHGEAQRREGRRVTMKYFCYQTFGVPLPFM